MPDASTIEPVTATVKVEVSIERLKDLVTTGFEGGVNYWAQIIGYEGNTGGVERELRLDFEAIKKGLGIMAEKYPKHFHDFMQENDDAITGDVFLQCCLLGNVDYG